LFQPADNSTSLGGSLRTPRDFSPKDKSELEVEVAVDPEERVKFAETALVIVVGHFVGHKEDIEGVVRERHRDGIELEVGKRDGNRIEVEVGKPHGNRIEVEVGKRHG
jgi:hypothetical protein